MKSRMAPADPRKGSPLTSAELAYFRQLLSAQRSETLESCQGLIHDALHRSEVAGLEDTLITDDPVDLSPDACDQDLSLSFLGRAQRELREITRALENIDQSKFGVCDECGHTISKARLEAIPTASTCLECKSLEEVA